MTFLEVGLVSSIDYLRDLSRSIAIDKNNSADIYRLVFKDRHLQAYDHNKLPPWGSESAPRCAAQRDARRICPPKEKECTGSELRLRPGTMAIIIQSRASTARVQLL